MNLTAFGLQIKKAREAKGLTQEELAVLMDMSATHMSVLERGYKPPKLETFVRLANVLEVSADYLLQDAVDKASAGAISELSERVAQLPVEEQKRFYRIAEAFLAEE